MTDRTPEEIRQMIDGVERLSDTVIEDRGGRILIQDNDCHWYLISSSSRQQFADWVDWMESMDDRPVSLKGIDFDDSMIGDPGDITIIQWRR